MNEGFWNYMISMLIWYMVPRNTIRSCVMLCTTRMPLDRYSSVVNWKVAWRWALCMRKVCMAKDYLRHGSMVGWFMPEDTSLPHGFLGREFSVFQASLMVCAPPPPPLNNIFGCYQSFRSSVISTLLEFFNMNMQVQCYDMRIDKVYLHVESCLFSAPPNTQTRLNNVMPPFHIV